MDWDRAARRADPRSVPGRVFSGLKHPVEVRRSLPQLDASTASEVVDLGHPRALVHVRRHPMGPLLAAHNLTERPQRVDAAAIEAIIPGLGYDRIAGAPVQTIDGGLPLAPYQARWLTARPDGTDRQ